MRQLLRFDITGALFFVTLTLMATSNVAGQERIAARVDAKDEITFGPAAVQAGANGVIASGALFKAGVPPDSLYKVSGANNTSMEANAQEKPRMETVMTSAEALRGKQGDEFATAKKDLAKVAKQQIVTAMGRFVLNNKGQGMNLSATALAFDNMGFPRISAVGNQQYQAAGPAGLTLGATIKSESLNRPRPAGAMSAGFVVNRDPMAVEWNSSMHALTLNLDEVRLFADSDPGGTSSASMRDLAGAFVNGTLDLQTTSPPTDLFDFSLGISAVNGSERSMSIDLDYFAEPGGDPSMSFVRDSAGNTTLDAVRGELARQFGLLRIDPTSGDFYGFNQGYSITMGVPGTVPTSVLFLDQIGATAESVPEPATVFYAFVGVSLVAFMARKHSRSRSTLA